MTQGGQDLKDDVDFLRALADGGSKVTARDGAVLVAVGVIFGMVALQYWAVFAGALVVPRAWNPWLWLDGLVPYLGVMALVSARLRGRAVGGASRALSAAWGGVGSALMVAVAGLAIAGWRLGMPLFVSWVFPLVLFTLFGAAWVVAYAVRRRAAYLGIAIASFAAAVLCGVVMGQPEEWLVLAAGLFLLVAAPGVQILLALRKG